MKFESKVPANREGREVADPFPVVHRLFTFAKENTDERSSDRYYEPVENAVVQDAIPLPSEFSLLVAQYPGEYFVAYFEDRADDYYAPGTRCKEVLLSTSPKKHQSDTRLREILFREYAPKEGKGNVIYMTVMESVNEALVVDLNEGEEIRPYGRMEREYEISAVGTRSLKRQEYQRLDEGIFDWGGISKRVRWLRKMHVEVEGKSTVMTHKDTYLVGLLERGGSEGSLEVEIEMRTRETGAQEITIGIGLLATTDGKEIFSDPNAGVHILEKKSSSRIETIDQMDILKQDPNYVALLERPIDKEKLLAMVVSKIDALKADWDKRGTIFSSTSVPDVSHVTPRLTQAQD